MVFGISSATEQDLFSFKDLSAVTTVTDDIVNNNRAVLTSLNVDTTER